jgi:ribonuclease HI
MKYTIFCDGGARGNPGPAATGYIISNQKGKRISDGGSFLGTATNNVAEYKAVIEALEKLKDLSGGGNDEVEIYVDSQLVAQQLKGLFKVKNSTIRELVLKVRQLEPFFLKVNYVNVNRAENKEADNIVNQILDKKIYGT